MHMPPRAFHPWAGLLSNRLTLNRLPWLDDQCRAPAVDGDGEAARNPTTRPSPHRCRWPDLQGPTWHAGHAGHAGARGAVPAPTNRIGAVCFENTKSPLRPSSEPFSPRHVLLPVIGCCRRRPSTFSTGSTRLIASSISGQVRFGASLIRGKFDSGRRRPSKLSLDRGVASGRGACAGSPTGASLVPARCATRLTRGPAIGTEPTARRVVEAALAVAEPTGMLREWLHELGEIAWLVSVVAALSLLGVGLAIALAAAT